jgi:urease gamma subunit
MKLSEIKRDFITSRLKIKPREKKLLHIRSDTEKKDDAITGALDEYLRREGKVFETLREIEKVKGTENVVSGLETELGKIQAKVKKASRDEADAVFKQAYKDLEDIKDRANKQLEIIKKNPDFFPKLDEARKALATLKAHPQKDHVQNEITKADQKLTAAVQAYDQAKYADALARVAEAKTLCDDGKGFADKFNAYRIARAPTVAILANMKGQFANAGTWDTYNNKLAKADTDAATPKRKYAKATKAVGEVRTGMGDTLKTWTKDSLQEQIDELKKVKQIKFVDADLKQLEAWRNSVDGKIASGEWGNMDVLTTRALEYRVAATDRATRRQNYLDEKKKATDAIAALKSNTAMATKADEFEKTLKDKAEPLATAEAQRFEEAIDVCKKVEADCTGLAKVDGASKKYQKQKESLSKRLEALQKLPAAPHMADAINSLKDLLSEGEKRVAPGTDDWDGGLEWLGRMANDLTAAEELAKSLSGATKAHDTATSANDEAAIKKGVAQVRSVAKKVAEPPGKDLLKAELTQIEDACGEALKQAAAKKVDDAQKSLKKAADLLVAAENAKALHANFDKIYEAAEQRRDAVAKLVKGEIYKPLKSKVDSIQPFLAQAKEEAKAGNFTAASATIAKADVAAKEAENLAAALKAFDAKEKPLAKRLRKIKGSDNADIDKIMGDARKKAEALQFDEANKLLSKAQAKMDSLKIKDLLKSGKNNDELVKTAKEMLKMEGGTELVDQFVKSISGEANFDIIAKLAKERFGIELKSDAGHKTVSAKAIWEVMAEVPEKHATNSPSLKSVKRETPSSSGGAYNWFDKSITMNGRPNDSKTEKFDAATREKALGIPPDHDNANDPYAPVDDTPANYFNMTVLHEVGHAVDDRLGFMNGKVGQAAFGGWQQYSDLTLIADDVAKTKKYDKNYVLQLLNGYTPEAPPMPDAYAGGQAAWEKAKAAVDEWYTLASTKSEIWYSHAKSKKAAIGDVVYQEAYAKQWVSYLLPERSKGVTAYQWRAPGEWFAEIYMAWYGKKLKPNHPFAPWLKAL